MREVLQDIPVVEKDSMSNGSHPVDIPSHEQKLLSTIKVTITLELWLSLVIAKVLDGLYLIKGAIEASEHVF